MTRLGPRLRRFVLTAHVVSSVGWLGAVVVFVALAAVGLTTSDPQTARAAYLAMDAAGWTVLVPLSLSSLLSGLIQGFGSKWGVFRHYWVVMKLVINVVASFVLVLYMGTLEGLAAQAKTAGDLAQLRDPSPMIHTLAALVLLVGAAILSVYKPAGLTRYGWRRRLAERGA